MACEVAYLLSAALFFSAVTAQAKNTTTTPIVTEPSFSQPDSTAPSTTVFSHASSDSSSSFPMSTPFFPTMETVTTTSIPSILDDPLNRYLIYGGAGAAGLLLLFVFLCLIALCRRCLCNEKGHRESHALQYQPDTHAITLMNIDAIEQSIDEDVLLNEKLIPVTEFTARVSELRLEANSGFEDEFDTLAKITRRKPSYSISQLPENEPKNRFDNVYPFDATRVILTKVDGDQLSDYINASYINGHEREGAYIAAQGPLAHTVGDFWRMIWEFKLTTIIMLTETMEAGKDKCHRYWPSSPSEPWDVGYSLVVTMSEQIPFAEYKVKILKVENKMDPESCVPLIVTHYHFSAWPDHGVPADKTSLIHFLQRVRRHHPYFNSPPLLVHCSAGVGRTGTFITLDSMIQRMKSEDTLNIFAFLRRMRQCRPLMVQTEEQYIFIHDALDEFITCGDTSLGVANLRIAITRLSRPDDSSESQLTKQFMILNKVSCKVSTINSSEGKKPYNTKKNRYSERVPYNVNRVCLKPSAVKGSDYVNASYIDGYKHQRGFIAAQSPLRSTVNEFWRMIWENQCRAVVSLADVEDMEDGCVWWPVEEGGVVVFGKLKVTLLSIEVEEDLIIRRMEVREDTPYHVPGVIDYLVMTQVQHCDWFLDEVPTTASVLQIIDKLLKVQRSTGNHAITVTCNDGMGRTGAFITIFSQLERIKTESICDVFQCIKAMRLQRPLMVKNEDQLEFCYQTLADYLDTFDKYANFK